MSESHAVPGRHGYLSCQSWANPVQPPFCKAMTATCPFLDCTSVIVTRANSLFDVSVTPVTTLLDGNCQVGFVPDAVCVPPALTSPDENTITPQFAQPPMPRAIHTGMPGLPFTAAVLHV